MTTTLTIALDWTPNTNHTPFYVAQHLNLLPSNLNLRFVTPADDQYSVSPVKKVLTCQADIALGPSESVLAHQDDKRDQVVAVAALLGKDASAIVTLDPEIKSPKDLRGKRYASYRAKYEEGLVREMIKRDIGHSASKANVHIDVDEDEERLGIWQKMVDDAKRSTSDESQTRIDFTWIFLPWEGLQPYPPPANIKTFTFAESGISYGYSPLLIVSRSWLQKDSNQNALRQLLASLAKAVQWTIEHPKEAAEVLRTANPSLAELQDAEFLDASQRKVNGYYTESDGGDEPSWGRMKPERWQGFVDVLRAIEKDDGKGKRWAELDGDVARLYTNDFLSEAQNGPI
jgi:ABC-type nitrate/sulfonate/bicarbonate transport system substrate-binding protein